MKFASGPQIAVQIEWIDGAIAASHLSLSDAFSCSGADAELLEWLTLYAKGIQKSWSLFSGTPFQREVMQTMQKIPLGQTMTYGELAHVCGRPHAARAVGGACKQNRFPLFVPCHRVVRASGKLGGFAYGLEIKRRLLAFEAGFALPR